jgi:hypothetical protein
VALHTLLLKLPPGCKIVHRDGDARNNRRENPSAAPPGPCTHRCRLSRRN